MITACTKLLTYSAVYGWMCALRSTCPIFLFLRVLLLLVKEKQQSAVAEPCVVESIKR